MLALINSPPFLAALRNVLSALGGALALFGFMTMTPGMIDKIIDLTQALGVLIGALATLGGLTLPAIAAFVAQWRAQPLQQVKSAAAAANDPAQTDAARGVVKEAMIAATENLPEVNHVERVP